MLKKADDGPPLIPLSLFGWEPWNNEITLTRGVTPNECIVNSNGRIAGASGFINTTLNNLQNRMLVLFFSNTSESQFNGHRMFKIHYNEDDFLLLPVNEANIIAGEFLPDMDTPPERGIEYAIPSDFDGRLSFVFYQAVLNNFTITAYYR